MHRDKKSRIYHIKIWILSKNQKFSSTSFPHVFKAIGPLESNLETKNHFFITFKKVTFSVCRILNAKTKKSEVFLKHFFNIDFIWGKSTFPKIAFLPFVSSININVFYWKYSFRVLLWLSILLIFVIIWILHTINITCWLMHMLWICTNVILKISILFIFSMLQIIKFRCFEAIILQKKLFWDQKTSIFDPN